MNKYKTGQISKSAQIYRNSNIMSGDMTDTDAVVDKSKKTKFRNITSSQLPLNSDPQADLYSVVD